MIEAIMVRQTTKTLPLSNLTSRLVVAEVNFTEEQVSGMQG